MAYIFSVGMSMGIPSSHISTTDDLSGPHCAPYSLYEILHPHMMTISSERHNMFAIVSVISSATDIYDHHILHFSSAVQWNTLDVEYYLFLALTVLGRTVLTNSTVSIPLLCH